MATYVIGDVHGCYKEFMEFINRLNESDSDAQFILVGDIIDRGPQAFQMVKWAMENITNDGKYQMVIGNHEVEKIGWYEENKRLLDNEEDFITDRYDLIGQFKLQGGTMKDIAEAVNWFKTLPYYKDITVNNQRFIIAHANIPYSIVNKDGTLKTDLKDRDKDFIIWDRDIDSFKKIPNTILVHGHTPTVMEVAFPLGKFDKEQLGKIIKTENRYNIDCGLVYDLYYDNANLAALRLDDLEEFYLY